MSANLQRARRGPDRMKTCRWFLLGLVLTMGVPRISAAESAEGAQTATEADKAAALFERAFQDRVDRSPEWQTSLGFKTDYDKWTERSEAREIENLSRALGFLAELKRTVDFGQLDPATQLSYRLFEYQTERFVRSFPFRFHGYEIDQMGGPFNSVPNLLITQHRIDTIEDAQAYITRLRGIAQVLAQTTTMLDEQVARGIIPPRWVFPRAAEIGRNVISGAPFDESGADSPLWADIQKKVGALDEVEAATKAALLADARSALVDVVAPACTRLLARWDDVARLATDDDGVWKLPDGLAYYNRLLAIMTTTTLTADEIHATGRREVARLHREIHGVMERVGFTGDLQAFFSFMREDPRFYLPDTPEGRQEYLDRATAVVDAMKAKLDSLFLRQPRADMIVKVTEPYREKTAGKAFYQSPAPNGSRPGMYYVTLYDMREMPTYQIEAIAYHEGLPGHHMQIAIAQELTGLPRFRRFGGHTAYIEGWGLYCELLPKEAGFYEDPYSDYGRLAMELFRAVRLVVDTGIHAQRWTRQQAIDYFLAHTSQSESEVVREIERYIMWPGQATSYKIGMLKILELRERARTALGPGFDLREFHDVLLRDGSIPLDLLEEQVEAWIAATRAHEGD